MNVCDYPFGIFKLFFSEKKMVHIIILHKHSIDNKT